MHASGKRPNWLQEVDAPFREAAEEPWNKRRSEEFEWAVRTFGHQCKASEVERLPERFPAQPCLNSLEHIVFKLKLKTHFEGEAISKG
jgi:hypothetical protein